MIKIADLRRSKNISQYDLAKAIGVTQASVSRWEQNQLSIIGANLIKLSNFFGVSTDDLLGIERVKGSD